MNLNVIYQLARIRPLASWSVCAVMIGIAVSIHSVGFEGVSWLFVAMGGCIAILLQYVAHPLNDIIDYDVDKATNIKGTGRIKVLVSNAATKMELWFLSFGIIYVVILLTGLLYIYLPLTPFFVFIGLFAVIGYNVDPLKLAYKPFFEWYAVIPVNIGMVVAIVYVATGELTSLALAAGVVHAFAAVAPYITSRSMDYKVDREFGKMHTVATYPYIPWCTLLPAIGFGITLIFTIFMRFELFILSQTIFIGLVFTGAAADMYRLDTKLHCDQAADTAFVRRLQFALCMANGILLSVSFILI